MIPSGFKVNGQTVGRIPKSFYRIVELLEKLPKDELLTSVEVAARLGISRSGDYFSHPALSEYREKVGTKLFWGSKQAIQDLRNQMTEETND